MGYHGGSIWKALYFLCKVKVCFPSDFSVVQVGEIARHNHLFIHKLISVVMFQLVAIGSFCVQAYGKVTAFLLFFFFLWIHDVYDKFFTRVNPRLCGAGAVCGHGCSFPRKPLEALRVGKPLPVSDESQHRLTL
jgi:hypothetical protein